MDNPTLHGFGHAQPESLAALSDEPNATSERDKSRLKTQQGAPTKNVDDNDTCRICRGEGTFAEPLFYPCKCSGSIKFVHQECLMEWLSHSQKKHCELCKTSFRFTKLYDSSMPSHLPPVIFAKKAALHLFLALVTWLRGFLVAAIWLLWLPWSMRFVWWGLFWIGDGGWSEDLEKLRNGLGTEAALPPLTRLATQNTTGPLMENNSKLSTYRQVSLILLGATKALLYSPVAVAKHIFDLFRYTRTPDQYIPNVDSKIPPRDIAQHTNSTDRDSLLSYVSFFRNLTPSSAVNKFVIDVSEGLIITLAVVTASILVFLIREWVVQQPGHNFPALAVNAQQDDGPVDPAPNAEDNPQDPEQTGLPHPEGGNDQEEPVATTTSEDEHTADQSAEQSAEQSAKQDQVVEKMSGFNIRAVTNSLRRDQALLQAIMSRDATLSSNDLERARSLIYDTLDAMEELKKSSRAALADENVALARFEKKKYDTLYLFLTRFDSESISDRARKFEFWKSFIGPSLEALLRRKFHTPLANTEIKAVHLSAQGPSATTYDRFTSDSAPESSSDVRPALPQRDRSSLAISIHRELLESTETDERLPERFRSGGDEEAGNPYSLLRDTEDIDSTIERNSQIEEHHNEDRLKNPAVGPVVSANQSSTIDNELSAPHNVTLMEELELKSLESEMPALPGSTAVSESDSNMGLDGLESPQDDDIDTADQNNDVEQETDENARETWNQANGAANRGLRDRILDWIFDDPSINGRPRRERVDGNDDNEERVVQDLANEAPFVPFVDAQPLNRAANNEGEPAIDVEDDAQPIQQDDNAHEAEAVEDAEDLDGIWELIGMQGPLTAVLQNAVFCAVFMAAAVTSAVWFPYLAGKLVLLFVANPIQMGVSIPLQAVSGTTNFVIDLVIFTGCTVLFWLDFIARNLLAPISWVVPGFVRITNSKHLGSMMVRIVESSLSRMSQTIVAAGKLSQASRTDLSFSSLMALRIVKLRINGYSSRTIEALTSAFNHLAGASSAQPLQHEIQKLFSLITTFLTSTAQVVSSSTADFLSGLRSGNLSLTVTHNSIPPLAEGGVVRWTPMDRFITVWVGYCFFALAATLYLRRGDPFSTSQQGKKVERVITEILQQSGGVLKVIFIISIEMILFPLYCGLLLDIAMLPLFQTTIHDRIELTLNSPWTSAFVHWFLGTCYMFHFALFVSMCRKIFRRGVLYFIRDPDDPTFHPVRDVLDRSVSSQLKKIGFSALVYGALVMVCMGSVVWSIAMGIGGIFPIRWSPNSPLLGFPVDLLLYNLFAPLALQFFRPSKGLHALYELWFRYCAKYLRLNAFLFVDAPPVGDAMGENSQGARHRDGKFVRAPASDQVRIPKGHQVFLEVDENNRRVDGLEDKEDGVHGSTNPHYALVWIPPWYRLRIAIFAFSIWGLTAFLGLFVTIFPLLVGRYVLSQASSDDVQISDVYAFSTGLFLTTLVIFVGFKMRQYFKKIRLANMMESSIVSSISQPTYNAITQLFRILFTYASLLVLIPSLLALLIEFYFIMPLHTYTTVRKSWVAQEHPLSSPPTHTLFFLQDCTLGLLYLRVFLRLLLWNADSRPAVALHGIVAGGWLNPNVRIATRCFIAPFCAVALFALAFPAAIAYIASALAPRALAQLAHSSWMGSSSVTGVAGSQAYAPAARAVAAVAALDTAALRIYMLRFAYPACLFLGAAAWGIIALARIARNWRDRIRDEVYLIGERLHNFAERRPPTPPLERRADASRS